ncbi:MAG: metal-dependent transcriptional regulator [Pirellulales bacterium]|nr:metal-dependent transcriptional regulator [Planctomycetales bacterium]
MATLTVENYVKAIYQICAEPDGDTAATGQLASALGVSPGTVTSMLKTLGESGLATYTPYEGVQLTEAGRQLALDIVRRHRLIELFLARTLDLSWAEVHEEAEHLEHAVSDALVDRIDAFLGHPNVDPHGDPIPRSDGSLPSARTRSLVDCQPGESFRLARVTDQSVDFLGFLTRCELALDCRLEIVENRPDAGVVTLLVGGRNVTLGYEPARKLRVAAAD